MMIMTTMVSMMTQIRTRECNDPAPSCNGADNDDDDDDDNDDDGVDDDTDTHTRVKRPIPFL